MSLGSVAEIEVLFAAWGDEHYDEQLSQLEHALQCAALAYESDASPALVAAALLHDIGHLSEMQAGGGSDFSSDLHHEDVGRLLLVDLFPASVTDPIALHVEAKRYLVATEPTYASLLSEGSRRSLEAQGGAMSADECAGFIALPGAQVAISLRRWDDLGKAEDLRVRPFEFYLPILDRLALKS